MSELAHRGSVTRPRMKKGVTAVTTGQVAPPTLPSIQKVMLRSWSSSAMKVSRPVIAPAVAFTAIPASISVVTSVWPCVLATR